MTAPTRSIEVPVEQCYVAVATKPPGRLNQRVAAYAVEGQLPRPIDELCLAWRTAGDQLIVVAVDLEVAGRWLTEGVLSARVVTLPEGARVEAGPIELLARSFLPSKIRRYRRYRMAAVAAMLGLGCLAVAFGLHRRTSMLLDEARAAETKIRELVRDALPTWRADTSPQLALTGEMRRLGAIASEGGGEAPADSRGALAAFFEAWPTTESFRVESVEAVGGRLTLRSIAPSHEAAIALAAKLANAASFESALPQIQTQSQREGDMTRLEVTFSHTGDQQ